MRGPFGPLSCTYMCMHARVRVRMRACTCVRACAYVLVCVCAWHSEFSVLCQTLGYASGSVNSRILTIVQSGKCYKFSQFMIFPSTCNTFHFHTGRASTTVEVVRGHTLKNHCQWQRKCWVWIPSQIGAGACNRSSAFCSADCKMLMRFEEWAVDEELVWPTERLIQRLCSFRSHLVAVYSLKSLLKEYHHLVIVCSQDGATLIV